MRVMRLALALLWTGVAGCASFTRPPAPGLHQRLREYYAVRSSGG
jgi:hypothetical protein